MFTKTTRILATAALGLALAASLDGGLATTGDTRPGVDVRQDLVTTEHGSQTLLTGASDFDAFLESLVQDSATYWSQAFANGAAQGKNGPWQPISYRIIDGDDTVDACPGATGALTTFGDPHDYDWDIPVNRVPAAYCKVDMTVYLSSQWLYNRVYLVPASPDGDVNDFGVAYAVAHEMGHAVQHELGIEVPEGATTVSPTELQADCLAGIWGNAKYYENVLDGNDVEQGVETAAAVGDSDWEDVNHHGFPAERANAFMVGYDSGDASQCTVDLPGSL